MLEDGKMLAMNLQRRHAAWYTTIESAAQQAQVLISLLAICGRLAVGMDTSCDEDEMRECTGAKLSIPLLGVLRQIAAWRTEDRCDTIWGDDRVDGLRSQGML